MYIDWHIGDVIRKLRTNARMNQTALATKVGVNKATIVRAEDGDGKVARDTYLKIARALKTDLAALEAEAVRLQSGAQPRAHVAVQDTGV
jgi:DNA-binding XRE family transcriptional regulator